MTIALYFFVPLAIVAAILCNIGIWAPRKMWIKLSGLAAAALFMPLTYGALADLLSRPKPVSLEWAHRNVNQASLVGATMKEGEAIFLWLQMPATAEPRAYRLPWSRKMAQQLQEAQREARKNKNGVKVRLPFENSQERREKMFYAAPQQALPPKPVPQSDNPVYVPPPQGQI